MSSIPAADAGPRPAFDRAGALARYRALRERSRALFDLVVPESFGRRPIPLRLPILFYEGHLPAFSFNTLVKRALGRPPVDEAQERLFARGIDPEDEAAAGGPAMWPEREPLRALVARWDAAVEEALATATLEVPGHPLLDGAEAVHTILEHEALHHETLLYMLHRLDHAEKRRPAGPAPWTGGEPPPPGRVRIPAGTATLGAARGALAFGWDNEFPERRVEVPAFEIDVHDVTNRDFLEFVEAGGYDRPEWWTREGWAWREAHGVRQPPFWRRDGDGWAWRGLFEDLPLPPAWPVWVTQEEAAAYARWRGARLPTEAEYHRAAYGTPSGEERAQPWGHGAAGAAHGNLGFAHWDPAPAGAHPAGASAWGVHDLVGNGWEWTSTPFAGFPGFRPMASYPEYSADFFDGKHFVMKGASPVTAPELVRRSFRNWFRPAYPYVYAAFRCVRDAT